MRSCLKLTPRSSTENIRATLEGTSRELERQCLKSVSFCEADAVEVHIADEWDRTPMEPARKLSYDDVLELKSLQIELARTNKLAYPNTLSAVPIGLLPLLPDTPAPSPALSPPLLPSPSQTMSPMATPPSPPSTPPRPQPSIPAGLPRRKLNIALMPLLDSPSQPSQPQSPDPPRAEHDRYPSDADNAPAEKHLQRDMERSLPTPSSTPALPEPLVISTQGTESGPRDEPRLDNSYFPSSSSHPLRPVPIAPRPMAHLTFHLQGIDSPSLLTPSPFSLYPPTPPGLRGPKPLPNAGFCWDPELAEDDVAPSGPLPTDARSSGGALGLTRMQVGPKQVGPVRAAPPPLYPHTVTFKRRAPASSS